MGIGREVADAYIDVHGDLKKFRKDLEEAAPAGQEAGREFAESFGEGFEKRAQRDLDKRWSSILDALYSGDKFDFGKMIDTFDPTDFDSAISKIRELGEEAVKANAIDPDDWADAAEQISNTTDAMKEAYEAEKLHGEALAENNRLEREHAEALRENIRQNRILGEEQRRQSEWESIVRDALYAKEVRMHEDALRMNQEFNNRRRKGWEDAIRMNEAFERSFEGMVRRMNLNGIEDDFKKISQAMVDADFSKFAKGFDSLDDVAKRVNDVTDAMKENGRITEENAYAARFWTNEYIQNKKAEQQAEKDALDAARELREEQERYKKSLDGMVEAAHFQKIEGDFRKLTDAIGTADFSKFGEGATSLQEFRDKVIITAGQMREFGKINDEEFGKIIGHLDKVSLDLDGFGVKLDLSGSRGRDAGVKIESGMGLARAATSKIGDVLEDHVMPKMGGLIGLAQSLGQKMAGTVSHFKGLAGLNVLGDMIQQGLDLAKNIDRVALNMGGAALKIGSAASLIITGAGGLINVAADIGSMAGIGWLAPGFLAAAGIQIGVLVAAFKDMKTKLKDLGPQFSALQDSISDAFWKQAEQPIRNLTKSLMPTLKTQLKDTADRLGDMFGALADGFTKNATPERVQGMFEKMNEAIGIAKGAMEPLTGALVTLGEHASGYFKDFAEGVVGMSKDFEKFVTDASKDGRLKKWTDDAIEAFKDAGRSIGGLVEIFGGINKAAEDAGLGGLKEMADGLERMADIANSPDFQGALTTYFEGAKAGADEIIGAINDRLMPALGDIAPTMSAAMETIGAAMGTAIGYIADIIENPKVQDGITALSDGVKNAIETIEPAIQPIGDSLGSLLDIAGHILENVAKIATTFMVVVGPEVDKIGRKFEELADPLTGAVQQAITDLGPLLSSVNTNFVTPLVNGLKDIIPEIQGFVTDIAPDLKSIADTVGPAFKTLAEEVLPNLVSFARQLADSVVLPTLKGMVEFLTPAFGTALTEVGAGLKNMAEGIKMLKGESNDFKWPWEQPGTTDPKLSLRERWGQASDNTFWEDLGNVIFGGSLAGTGQRMMEAWNDDISKSFDWLAEHVADGWNKIGDKFKESFKSIGEFFEEAFSEDTKTTVNKFFEDKVFKPIRDGWDDAMEGIKGWWEDTKKGFQEFMSGMLGFDTTFEDDAQVDVAGGGQRGVGGKITPEMIGLGEPDEGWLQGTIDSVGEGIGNFFNGLVETFTTATAPFLEGWNAFWEGLPTTAETLWTGFTTWLGEQWTTLSTGFQTWFTEVQTGWDTFWGGLPTKLGEIWTNITTFLATKWAEITLGISTWWTGIQAGWNTFWDGVWTKASQIWTTITTWIQTKYTEIKTGIEGFITQVRTNWDNFWNTVNTKVQTIWTTISTWIQTKATEIKTNISNFITTVRTNWDSFWNTVNTKVQTIWNGIKSWIDTKVGEIKTNIGNFITDIKTRWESFWSGISDKVKEWWGKIVKGVQDGVKNVIDEAKAMPGKARDAIGDTLGLLAQKGRDFAQGFINGIGELVDDIASAAANFVQAAIKAAQAAQDSNSPSRITLGLGHDYGDGYVNGIGDRMDAAAAAGASMAEAALSGISTSKMYAAGVDAAMGLADGLSSQKSSLESVMSGILPDVQATVSAKGIPVALETAGQAAVSRVVTFEEGAIQVEAKQADASLVASTVRDDLDDLFTTTSL